MAAADPEGVARLVRDAQAAAVIQRDVLVSAEQLEELASHRDRIVYEGRSVTAETLHAAARRLRELGARESQERRQYAADRDRDR